MAVHIDVDEFKFEEVTGIGKHFLFLGIRPADGDRVEIPLLIANGANRGKTLVVFAAIHGDELEGVQAIQEVFRELNTDEMRGRLIAIPVANPPAFQAGKRLSPVDSMNLARTFPGNKNGSLTERIAFYLSEMLIPQADFFLDLHSSGVAYLMPLMTGYDAGDTPTGKASGSAAQIFGTPVIWGHEEISPGRSISSAMDLGIPWLYVESPNGARVSQADLPFYVNGIFNLLKHLDILPGEITGSAPEYSLIGSGDVDRTQAVSNAGFFVQKVGLLDHVEKGELIGEVRDLFGETIEEIYAERSGYVGLLRAAPLVDPGDPVCLVAEAMSAR